MTTADNVIKAREGNMEIDRQKMAYTVQSFIECFEIGQSTIYRHIADGKLKIKKDGKRTLITAESAHAWFNNLPDR